uniref:Putative secreted protein n=1 Tax=Anopheles darlingi TaxID=43151 RepID=A0A2M4DN06_ANODA
MAGWFGAVSAVFGPGTRCCGCAVGCWLLTDGIATDDTVTPSSVSWCGFSSSSVRNSRSSSGCTCRARLYGMSCRVKFRATILSPGGRGCGRSKRQAGTGTRARDARTKLSYDRSQHAPDSTHTHTSC